MKRADYRKITEHLIAIAESDERMIGLLALGSMADESRVDEWSDHDFWIVASPESVEDVRNDIGWLPDGDRIALWFAETEHGRSAVYDDGHLLEYAVFAPTELEVASANDYRVLVGDGEIEQLMYDVVARTETRAADRRAGQKTTMGRLVVNLVIGLGRYARGEYLSANEHIRGHALLHLARLLGDHVESPEAALLDDLDPFRRFEKVHPVLGKQLETALEGSIPDLVETYLELIDCHLSHVVGDGFQPVRRLLGRAVAEERNRQI